MRLSGSGSGWSRRAMTRLAIAYHPNTGGDRKQMARINLTESNSLARFLRAHEGATLR